MIDFDPSISNSTSNNANDRSNDYIASKDSQESSEMFKESEFEDSESSQENQEEDGEWEEKESKPEVELDLTDDSKRVLDSDVLQVYFQKMGSHTLLKAEQEREVSKKIEDGVMEMKRVFCFSLPVQDYLEKLLQDLKNNKVRAVRLIAGLDEDDNLIEDEHKAQKKLITSLERLYNIAQEFRGITSKTGKKERERISKQLEKNLLKINLIRSRFQQCTKVCWFVISRFWNSNGKLTHFPLKLVRSKSNNSQIFLAGGIKIARKSGSTFRKKLVLSKK